MRRPPMMGVMIEAIDVRVVYFHAAKLAHTPILHDRRGGGCRRTTSP
jgi:hypothetical protein